MACTLWATNLAHNCVFDTVLKTIVLCHVATNDKIKTYIGLNVKKKEKYPNL